MHWDGTTWAVVPMHSIGDRPMSMIAVSAISADDASAVGNAYISHSIAAATMAMHRISSVWSLAPLPYVDGEYLAGLSGRASNDVWAVASSASYPLSPVALPWDGPTWTDVPSPDPGDAGAPLVAVDAVSADQA